MRQLQWEGGIGQNLEFGGTWNFENMKRRNSASMKFCCCLFVFVISGMCNSVSQHNLTFVMLGGDLLNGVILAMVSLRPSLRLRKKTN